MIAYNYNATNLMSGWLAQLVRVLGQNTRGPGFSPGSMQNIFSNEKVEFKSQ